MNNINLPLYIDANKKNAVDKLSCHFRELIGKNSDRFTKIVILCIGTDRATGDSLGPLTGSKLFKQLQKEIKLFGTLENPVHAKNLDKTINLIQTNFENPFIIVVDASLGSHEKIGFLKIGEGSLRPGEGAGKNLGEIGNIYITGIVNCSGYMDVLLLQTTKLYTVMKMAEIIADGISLGLNGL